MENTITGFQELAVFQASHIKRLQHMVSVLERIRRPGIAAFRRVKKVCKKASSSKDQSLEDASKQKRSGSKDSGEDVYLDDGLDLDSGNNVDDYMVTNKEGNEVVLETLKVVVEDKEEEVVQEETTAIVAESSASANETTAATSKVMLSTVTSDIPTTITTTATTITTTVTSPPRSKEVEKEVAGTLLNLGKTLPIPEAVIAPKHIFLKPTGPKPLGSLKIGEPVGETVKTKVVLPDIGKGKGIVEPEEPVLKFKNKQEQITHDEELSKRLYAEEFATREKEKQEEEEASERLIEEWNKEQPFLQASEMIRTEYIVQEWGLLDIDTRSKVLAERMRLLQKERAVRDNKAKKNKPPTKQEMRNQMMRVIWHMDIHIPVNLRKCTYEQVEEIYKGCKRRCDDFIPMNSEKEDEWIKNKQKRKEEILEESCSKEQEVDEEMEREERKNLYLMVCDKPEPINPTPVRAIHPISDWKIIY